VILRTNQSKPLNIKDYPTSCSRTTI